MLHGEGHILLREVEHVEDDGLLLAVLSDDGQLTLHQYAMVEVCALRHNSNVYLFLL